MFVSRFNDSVCCLLQPAEYLHQVSALFHRGLKEHTKFSTRWVGVSPDQVLQNGKSCSSATAVSVLEAQVDMSACYITRQHIVCFMQRAEVRDVHFQYLGTRSTTKKRIQNQYLYKDNLICSPAFCSHVAPNKY